MVSFVMTKSIFIASMAEHWAAKIGYELPIHRIKPASYPRKICHEAATERYPDVIRVE